MIDLNLRQEDRRILEGLGRKGIRPAALIPLSIRQRLVLLLYGDRGGEHFTLDDISDLIGVLPAVRQAFERMIRFRKVIDSHIHKNSQPSPPQHSADNVDGEKKTQESSESINAPQPLSTPDPSKHEGEEKSSDAANLRRKTLAGITIDKLEIQKGVRTSRSIKTLAGITSTRQFNSSASMIKNPPPDEAHEIDDAAEPKDRDPLASDFAVEDPPDASASKEGAAVIADADQPMEQNENDGITKEASGQVISEMVRWSDAPPKPDPQQADAVQPRHTLPIGPGKTEPSVVVNMGLSTEELLEKLCSGNPKEEESAISLMHRAGEEMLQTLEQRFPGPLWFDRKNGDADFPPAKSVSAVCRAILAFGVAAIPHIRSLLVSSDPDQRFYALLLARDLPHKLLLGPLEQRLFDTDIQIRHAAIEALKRYAMVPGFDNLLNSVRAVAASPDTLSDIRLISIETLAELRDTESLDILLTLLRIPDREVLEATRKALQAITLQDFGASVRKWTAWVKRNRSRSRIEWLIDGLTHNDESIRSRAGTELQQATQEYYGYHPALPKRDRQRIQKKYIQWLRGQRESR